MTAVSSQRAGLTRLGCVLQLAVVVTLMYFALRAGAEFWDYYQFKDAMKQEARFASMKTNEQIRKRLHSLADSLEMPEGAGDVSVSRDGNRIHIWTEYTLPVALPFKKQREFQMRPEVEESF